MENEESGFFSTLFNWDFTEFLTTRIIKGTYILWVGLITLYMVVGEYYCARTLTGGIRILGILAVPFVALIVPVYIRLVLETTFIFFRSEKHLRKIASEE